MKILLVITLVSIGLSPLILLAYELLQSVIDKANQGPASPIPFSRVVNSIGIFGIMLLCASIVYGLNLSPAQVVLSTMVGIVFLSLVLALFMYGRLYHKRKLGEL